MDKEFEVLLQSIIKQNITNVSNSTSSNTNTIQQNNQDNGKWIIYSMSLLIETKLILNSVMFDSPIGAWFRTLDMKDFFLQTNA